MSGAKKGTALAVAVLVVVALGTMIGCQAAPSGSTGLVTFHVSDVVAKAVMPSISLNADHYALAGTGLTGQAAGASFNLDVDAASPSASIELLPGDWSVAVVVWNTDAPSVAVGSGSAGFTVAVGSPLSVPIVCLPYAGDGLLQVNASWLPDVVASPSVDVDAKSWGGTVYDVPMTVSSSVTAEGSATLPAGWYTGFLKIYDATELNAGIAKTLRVAYNATTTWSQFLAVNQLEGGVVIDLDYVPGDPLALTVSPAEGSMPIYQGESQTFTVTGADNDGGTTLIYSWFLNGVATELSATNSHTLDAEDFQEGASYYLSAIVYQSDGRRAGDGQWTVQREAVNPMRMEVRWIGQAGRTYNVHLFLPNGSGYYNSGTIAGVDGAMSHVIYPAASGQYKIYIIDSVSKLEYWQESDGTTPAPTLVTVPTEGGQVFDFGALSFSY